MLIFITAAAVASHVFVWFVEAHRLLCVDNEVTCVNIVAFHDHFEDFRLVHRTFLHEGDDLILHSECMIDIVVELYLHLVLQLSILLEEVFVIDRVREVLIVLCQQMDLAVVCPRVESIAHRVLRPNTHVLATSQEQEPVDFLVKALPVKHMRHPSERIGCIQEGQRNLPRPEEWVDEEDVPREWH